MLLCAAFGLPAGGAVSRFESGPRVTQTMLGNGLRVVVVENHTVPLAQVAMWYRFGSADDPPDRTGVAHALEHMMFRGTHALSGTALDLVTARFGMDTNAETDHDYTHYYETGPADSVPLALHVEADRMRGLRLDPRDWKLERQAVLSELADSVWSDAGNVEEDVRSAAFGVSPFAHDPGGSPADVRRISVRDLRRAYDSGYQPANATLVVTGDVKPATVVRLARSLFGGIPGRAPIRHPMTEPIAARGFIVRRRALNDDIVDVALDAHGLGAPDASAEEIAEDLLQPDHAVLRDLIVDNGPCESYKVDDDSQLHGGLIHVACMLTFGTSGDGAVRAIKRALQQLPARVTATDIAYARRTDIAQTTYTCDSLTDEGDLFGQLIALTHVDPRQFDRNSARVSDSAIISVLRRWGTPVGAGVATNAQPGRDHLHARKPRSEHVAPAPVEAEIEPAWARIVARPFPVPAAAHVEAFTLPSGLRVYLEPRRGNGTVYLRGGLVRAAALSLPNATLERVAEQHSIVMDSDSPSDMHGFARDLPLMLSFLGDFWNAHDDGGDTRHDSAGPPNPQDAWIVVTGDVDPDNLRANVSRVFGDWHGDGLSIPSPSPSPSPSPNHRPRFLSYGIAGPSVRSSFLLPAPTRASPDFAPMMLLNAILGENGDLDARLAREVRTRRGLVYAVGSTYDADEGRLRIWFESTNRRFAAARTAVRDVVDGLRTGTVSAEERARAYNKLVALALREEASPDGVLDNLAGAATGHRTPDDVESLAALYAGVSRDDIRRLAAKELRLDRATEIEEGRAP